MTVTRVFTVPAMVLISLVGGPSARDPGTAAAQQPTCFRMQTLDTQLDHPGGTEFWLVLSQGSGVVVVQHRLAGSRIEVNLNRSEALITSPPKGSQTVKWVAPPRVWCEGPGQDFQLGITVTATGGDWSSSGGARYSEWQETFQNGWDRTITGAGILGGEAAGAYAGALSTGFVARAEGTVKVRPKDGVAKTPWQLELILKAREHSFVVHYHYVHVPGLQPGATTGGETQPSTTGGTGTQPGATGGTGTQPGAAGGTGTQPGAAGGTGTQPGGIGGAGTGPQPGAAGGTGTQPGGTGTGPQPGVTGGTGAQPGATGGAGSAPAGGATNTEFGKPPYGQPEPAINVPGMALQAGQRQLSPGELALVPVWLIRANNLANINFEVTYNAAVARPDGAILSGSLMDNALVSNNPNQLGLIRVGFAQTSGISGTGTVVYIPFRAVGRPGDRTALKLAVTTINEPGGRVPAIDRVPGEIVIVGRKGQGDCNGDGALTEWDALCALEMSVQLRPSRPEMDVDNSGDVTSRDATLILQSANVPIIR